MSAAAQPSVATLALGRWVEGEVVYFPGVGSRRALWKSPPRDSTGGELPCHTLADSVLAAHAVALAENPLADPLAALVELTPQRDVERWWLRDETGAALPLDPAFAHGWELLACSGGRPLVLAGLWDGIAFAPLSAITESGILQLTLRPA